MALSWQYTADSLLPDEAAIITSCTKGRALEFGSGRGLGAHALLAGRAKYILSVDEDTDFTEECAARLTDPRVEWILRSVGENGWYDDEAIPVPETPEDRFNTVVLDGPAEYTARAFCLPMLLDHAYLANRWQLLVTHTSLPEVKAFIAQWTKQYNIQRDSIYCERGMVRITPMATLARRRTDDAAEDRWPETDAEGS